MADRRNIMNPNPDSLICPNKCRVKKNTSYELSSSAKRVLEDQSIAMGCKRKLFSNKTTSII